MRSVHSSSICSEFLKSIWKPKDRFQLGLLFVLLMGISSISIPFSRLLHMIEPTLLRHSMISTLHKRIWLTNKNMKTTYLSLLIKDKPSSHTCRLNPSPWNVYRWCGKECDHGLTFYLSSIHHHIGTHSPPLWIHPLTFCTSLEITNNRCTLQRTLHHFV